MVESAHFFGFDNRVDKDELESVRQILTRKLIHPTVIHPTVLTLLNQRTFHGQYVLSAPARGWERPLKSEILMPLKEFPVCWRSKMNNVCREGSDPNDVV